MPPETPTRSKENTLINSSREKNSVLSSYDQPSKARKLKTASGKKPLCSSSFQDGAPCRLLSFFLSFPSTSGTWNNKGCCHPRAFQIWICRGALDIHSSARRRCVTPIK